MQPQFVRTIDGNPNRITINQHIHSAHSIKKFYRDEKVDYYHVKSRTLSRISAGDFKFCVKRAWSETAEHDLMERNIERKYFDVIDNLSCYDPRSQSQAISRYYLLCLYRFLAKFKERKDVALNGVSPSPLNKEQMEALEVNGYLYCDSNANIPFHIFEGARIQISIMQHMIKEFNSFRWGLVTAVHGEFLVADGYINSDINYAMQPVSPNKVFLANFPNGEVGYESVAELNFYSKYAAKEFFYGRDLKKCPVITPVAKGIRDFLGLSILNWPLIL